MNITVLMTGDEEDIGEPLDVARKALRDAADDADVAIGFENGSGDPKRAVIARRGFTGWQLEVTGTPSHSSQIFRETSARAPIFETPACSTASTSGSPASRCSRSTPE